MARRFLACTSILAVLVLHCAVESAAAPCGARAQPAQLRVLMPEADAELTVDGQATRQGGATRLFSSPPLEPGVAYTYKFAATWDPNGYTNITRTRTVVFQAGQELEVDLREADDRNPDKFRILYVPTPNEVVEAMCKLGEVGKGDVVYDLGCGDGRIVITAITKYGASRGVGMDIDPARIKDSNVNAKKAGVTDRVQFRQGDVLNIQDLADATVVMLYMGEDVNLRLRPILQKTLKPGARIVSHQFLMGDWKPVKSVTIPDDDGVGYDVHLWRIGADGGGKKE